MRTKLALGVLLLVVVAGAAGAALHQLATPGADMTAAAQTYLSSLTEEQRTQSMMKYDSPERLDWHFIPKDTRKGLQVKEMTQQQRQAAHELLRAALSDIGYQKTTKIMALEELLAELEKNRNGGPIRDAERYYLTIFGQPQEQGNWGLSFEGHHLSLNFAVQDGRVASSTPHFYGANPATIKTEIPVGVQGLEPGMQVLEKEEELAFKLLHSLDAQQRQQATIASEAPREIRGAGEAEAPQRAGEGITLDKLKEEQAATLKELVATYARNVPEQLAQRRMQQLQNTPPSELYFAWAGADQPGIGHYYRVEGKDFLIEFVNTQPDSAGNPANHIHCVWRDLNGDFAPLGQAGAGGR